MLSLLYIGFHVKYALFLSEYNEICVLSADFFKNNLILNFMKFRQVGAELFPVQGQTSHDEIKSRFSQF